MEKLSGVKKRKRIAVISSSDDEEIKQEDVLHKTIGETKVDNCSKLPECKIIVTRIKDGLVQGKENKTKRIISKFVDDSSDDDNVPHEANLHKPKNGRWKKNLENLCRKRDKNRHGDRYVKNTRKYVLSLGRGG